MLSLEDEIRLAIASESEGVRQLPWHLWEFYRRYGKTEVMFSPVTGSQPPSPPWARSWEVADFGDFGQR